jgi:20S proteasome subunit alpha 2
MLEKVAVICPNIGIVYSGMGPDFRILIAKARKSAQAYWKIYGEYPPTRVLTQEIATVMQQATQSGCVHQFRVSWRWNVYLVTRQWRTAIWCFATGCGVRRKPRANSLSGRPIRLFLGLEGKCDREKYDQCENIP